MRKVVAAVLVGLMLLVANPLAVYAGHTRVVVGASISFGYPVHWGPYPWRAPRYYWGRPVVVLRPHPYYYAAPPIIIEQQPPVYVQQDEQQADYWYYCQNPAGYYPYVQTCPEGWMKVVPDATPPNQ
jgi:hypothetical protein